jgi:hypothetical protein
MGNFDNQSSIPASSDCQVFVSRDAVNVASQFRRQALSLAAAAWRPHYTVTLHARFSELTTFNCYVNYNVSKWASDRE